MSMITICNVNVFPKAKNYINFDSCIIIKKFFLIYEISIPIVNSIIYFRTNLFSPKIYFFKFI